MLGHVAGTAAANFEPEGKVFIKDNSWYAPHFTPDVSQEKLLMEHIVNRAASALTYTLRSTFTKDLTTRNVYNF